MGREMKLINIYFLAMKQVVLDDNFLFSNQLNANLKA
jgi:hypothetical protein